MEKIKLDVLEMKNFLVTKLGEKEFYNKLNQYQQTPEAKQNFDDSFEGELSQQQYTQQTQSSGSQSSGDPLSNFFKKLFLGQINPVPGM